MNTVCLVSPDSLSARGSTPHWAPQHGVSQQQALLVHNCSDLGSGQAKAALAVSGDLLHLCVQSVEWVDCEVGQLHVHLPLKHHGEPGGEPHHSTFWEVSLYKHFPWEGCSVHYCSWAQRITLHYSIKQGLNRTFKHIQLDCALPSHISPCSTWYHFCLDCLPFWRIYRAYQTLVDSRSYHGSKNYGDQAAYDNGELFFQGYHKLLPLVDYQSVFSSDRGHVPQLRRCSGLILLLGINTGPPT